MATSKYESVVIQFTFNKLNQQSELVTIEMPKLRWTWRVNKKSFELIHGMFRTVKLIPDKLATARAIAQEKDWVANSKTNHHFLIDLIISLIEDNYLGLCDKLLVADSFAPSSEHHHISLKTLLCGYPDLDLVQPDDCQQKNLEQCVTDLVDHLKTVRASTSLESFDENCPAVLKIADGFLAGCQAYLQFVHPVIIYVQRLQEFDDHLATKHQLRLSERFEDDKAYRRDHLKTEYLHLVSPKN